MIWNYRLVRFKDKTARNGFYYEVLEVFYDEQGQPHSHADVSIGGDTIKESFENLQNVANGMLKSYLKYPEDFNGKVDWEE